MDSTTIYAYLSILSLQLKIDKIARIIIRAVEYIVEISETIDCLSNLLFVTCSLIEKLLQRYTYRTYTATGSLILIFTAT